MGSFKSFKKNKNCGSCTICESSFFLKHNPEPSDKDCVWQYIASLNSSWRPDRSKCFLTWTDKNIPLNFENRVGVNIELLDAMEVEFYREFLDFIKKGVMDKVPMFLIVPKGEDKAPHRYFLNNHLEAFIGKWSLSSEIVKILSGERVLEEYPDYSNVVQLSAFRETREAVPSMA